MPGARRWITSSSTNASTWLPNWRWAGTCRRMSSCGCIAWRLTVAVARRDNAFANAIGQLEKRWPDAARKLREEWGNALVQQGEWIGAVEAVWPVESLRAKA